MIPFKYTTEIEAQNAQLPNIAVFNNGFCDGYEHAIKSQKSVRQWYFAKGFALGICCALIIFSFGAMLK